jgi:hypothetical protein
MHSINVFLIPKEEIRNEKIEVLLGKPNKELKLTELSEGIFASTSLKSWMRDMLICEIETDYFGGFGDQSAKLFRGDEILYEGDTRNGDTSPINQSLKLMGVKRKPGMDEFDTIGLGNYRTNQDFE